MNKITKRCGDELPNILKTRFMQGRSIPIDRKKRAESIKHIMSEAQKTEISRRESFVRKLLRQMTYIDYRVYAVQLLLLAVGLWLIIMHTNEASETMMTQMLVAVLGAVFSVLDIYESFKSYKYNMWEIEAACQFNLKEVILQRHLIVGTTGIGCMLLLSAVTSAKTSQSFLYVTVMYMLPLMTICVVYLKILKLNRGKYSTAFITVVMTAFTAVFMTVYTVVLRLMQENEGVYRFLFLGCFIVTALYYVRNIWEFGSMSEEEIGWMA